METRSINTDPEKMLFKSSCKNNTQQNSPFHLWNLGTINIRSGKETGEGSKIYMVAKEAARANLVICCLQEVKYRNSGEKLISLDSGEKYTFLWYGHKKRREAGVGILIRQCPEVTFDQPDFANPRLMALNIQIRGFKIRMVNVYSPTNCDGSETEKDAFYRLLKKSCDKQDKHQKLVVLGDFNATTAVSLEKNEFDGFQIINDPICNDNGSRLKSFCRELRLCMSQTYFDHPKDKRYTWHNGNNTTKKVLDYVLVEHFVQNYVEECTADDEYDFDSDHRLVKTTLYTPSSKKARKYSKNTKNTAKSNKPDIKSLENSNIQKAFTTSVLKELNNPTTNSEERDVFLIICLEIAAQSTLPKVQKKVPVKEIWKDDKILNELLNKRKHISKDTEAYKSVTKDIKKHVQYIRNQKLDAEASKINQLTNERNVQELFRSFKSDNSAFKTVKSRKGCDSEKLKQFFKKHFTSDPITDDPIELSEIPEYLKALQDIQTDGINTNPPGEDEIRRVIRKQKIGKATNDVPMAYVKHSMGVKVFVEEICKLYTTIWQTKMIPSSWGHSKLVALWKGPSKGKIDDPKTYRGLQIGSTLCKILVMIIIGRIKTWYESQLLEQQQGFRSKRGTNDGIFIVKSIQQITSKMKKPAYALFVDLSAAFDHIERSWMFKSIKNRLPKQFDLRLVHLLESLYSKTTTALAETPDDVFELSAGVRQGGPESPMLYNLYMDHVMRIFLDECKRNSIKFLKLKYEIPAEVSSTGRISKGEWDMDWSGYADDLVLVFDDEESLRKAVKLLNEVFNRYRLKINPSKTKTMIFNQQYENRNYPTSIATLDGQILENVKTFRYLGVEVKHDEPTTGATEMNLRSDAAECKFYSLTKNLLNMKINIKIRAQILNSLVRSRITYSCQTWSVTKNQLGKMTSTYMSFLRKMTKGGYRRKENSWSFVLTNEDLIRIAKVTDLSTYIKEQQRNFVRKIADEDNRNFAKRLMFNSNRSIKTGPTTTLLSSVLKSEKCTPDELFRKLKIL